MSEDKEKLMCVLFGLLLGLLVLEQEPVIAGVYTHRVEVALLALLVLLG